MHEPNLQTRKARRHRVHHTHSNTLDIGETKCRHATVSLAWPLTCGGDGVPQPRHLGRLRRSIARSPSASRRLCRALTSLQRSNGRPHFLPSSLSLVHSKKKRVHTLLSLLSCPRAHTLLCEQHVTQTYALCAMLHYTSAHLRQLSSSDHRTEVRAWHGVQASVCVEGESFRDQ
jgi:hypothetical protein